jgi:hypothetical protein
MSPATADQLLYKERHGSGALSLVLRGMDPIFAAPDAEISRECGECRGIITARVAVNDHLYL